MSLRILTPDFGVLSSRAMALEAEFRKSHHYLKQHAESVAFFGGAAREGANISRRLEDCLAQQVCCNCPNSWNLNLFRSLRTFAPHVEMDG